MGVPAADDAVIGQKIARLRGGMSQAQLAELMRDQFGWRWSQATVWAIEKGERPLRFAEAQDLVNVLGAALDYPLDLLDLTAEPSTTGLLLALAMIGHADTRLHLALREYGEAAKDLSAAAEAAPLTDQDRKTVDWWARYSAEVDALARRLTELRR